jgi:hypothetical protein
MQALLHFVNDMNPLRNDVMTSASATMASTA